MTKKKIIAVFSILIVIAAIIAVCIAMSFSNKQRLQTTIQNFGIHETDDVTICNYDDNSGLWHDQTINLSTQKDFDLFVNENIMAPVTVTDEEDTNLRSDPQAIRHVISFEYINGSQTIYGKFTANSNSEMNYISLSIYG